MRAKTSPAGIQATKKPRDLIAGDVILIEKDLAIILSNRYPAITLPKTEAIKYCEPEVAYLVHVREDMWCLGDTTCALLSVVKDIKLINGLRVRTINQGPFLDYEERTMKGVI